MYTLSPSKSKKRSNYGEFLSQKCIVYVHDVLSSTAYKYTPNLETLLTQQYVCVNVHSDLIIHAFLLVFIVQKTQIRSLSGALKLIHHLSQPLVLKFEIMLCTFIIIIIILVLYSKSNTAYRLFNTLYI